MQWREIGLERGLVGEVGVIAEELQAAGVNLWPNSSSSIRQTITTPQSSAASRQAGRLIRKIPACAANAPGLYEGGAVKGYFGGD
jgi:hypothetical protein